MIYTSHMEKPKVLLVACRRQSDLALVNPLLDKLVKANWQIRVAVYEQLNQNVTFASSNKHRPYYPLIAIPRMGRFTCFLKALLSNLIYISESLDSFYKYRLMQHTRGTLRKFGIYLIEKCEERRHSFQILTSDLFINGVRKFLMLTSGIRLFAQFRNIEYDGLFVIGGFTATSGEDMLLADAKRKHVPSFVYFRSHDTLNSKGTLAHKPTHIFLQNDWQQKLLVSRHRLKTQSSITGSVFFNHLSLIRIQYRSLASSKNSSQHYGKILFLSSSRRNHKGEIEFFRQLVEKGKLYGNFSAEFFVRPHPAVVKEWQASLPKQLSIPKSYGLSPYHEQNIDEDFFNFDAFFCVNTSGIMDALILSPYSKVFLILNAQAIAQGDTSHFQNFIDCGIPYFMDIHDALKFVYNDESAEVTYCRNSKILERLLPNNDYAIENIFTAINSL